MSNSARNLISAINVLATEIEREIAGAPGVTFERPTDTSEGRLLAMRRFAEAAKALEAENQNAPDGQHMPRGEIASAMRRLEAALARRNKIAAKPRMCVAR
jgi:hypothetical protein